MIGGDFLLYENIIAYCEKEKIPVYIFEKKCGISNGTIGKWKNGAYKPSLATLEKIAAETKIPIAEWSGMDKVKEDSK